MPQIKIERAWWRPAAVISSAAVAFALTAVPVAALADEVGSQPSDELTKQEQVVIGDQGDSALTPSPSTPSSIPANNEGGSSELTGGVNGGTSGGSSSSETVTKPGNASTENGGSTSEGGNGSSSLPNNDNTNEGGLPGNESSGNTGNGNSNSSGNGSDSVTGNTGNGSAVTGETNTDTTPVPDSGGSAVGGDAIADSTLDSSGTLGNAASTSPTSNDLASLSDSAQTIADGEYVISSALDATKVIDVPNGTAVDGAYIQLYQGNGTAAQKWEVKWHDDPEGGYYTIGLAGTNKVLDVEWGNAFDGANVWLYEFNGGTAQRWTIEQNDGGFWTILSQLGAFYLDVCNADASNGSKIWIYSGNGTPAQQFNFLKYNPNIVGERYDLEDGVYIINAASDANGEMVLDVDGASFNDSANVQIFENNQSVGQRFYFESDGEGFYTITSLGSGKVLDVAGGSLVPTTNVQQFFSNYNDAQKWAIIKDDSLGCFYLVNKMTGLALDVSWGNYANNNNVWGYTFNRSEGQRWTFTKSEFLEDGQIYVIYTASDINKVLDIQDGSADEGKRLQSYSPNNTLAQRFEIEKIGDNEFRIRTASSGGWLTVSNGQVVQSGSSDTEINSNNTWKAIWKNGFFTLISGWADDSSTEYALTLSGGVAVVLGVNQAPSGSQHFFFRPAQLICDGYYEIASGLGSDLTLNVSNGSIVNQGNVQIYTKNGSNAQKFHIVWNGDGYLITAARSDYAVEGEWGGKVNQTNVWLYEVNGTIGQTWKAQIEDGGGVSFINSLSGLALDVAWGVDAPGTNVWLYDYNGGDGQVWKLSATTVPYGWVQESGTWKYYDRNGNMLTDSTVAYNLYLQIQNQYSDTNYLIAVDAVQCHVVLFQGSAGNWELVFDALAGTGDPYLASTDTDGYGVTGEGGNPWGSLRGYFKLGSTTTGYTDSNGRREYDSADQLKWFRSIYMDYGFHSTCGNYSDPSQVGKRISHGCIRLLEQYAKMIYDLPKYTMVAVLPSYNGSFQVDQR